MEKMMRDADLVGGLYQLKDPYVLAYSNVFYAKHYTVIGVVKHGGSKPLPSFLKKQGVQEQMAVPPLWHVQVAFRDPRDNQAKLELVPRRQFYNLFKKAEPV